MSRREWTLGFRHDIFWKFIIRARVICDNGSFYAIDCLVRFTNFQKVRSKWSIKIFYGRGDDDKAKEAEKIVLEPPQDPNENFYYPSSKVRFSFQRKFTQKDLEKKNGVWQTTVVWQKINLRAA